MSDKPTKKKISFRELAQLRAMGKIRSKLDKREGDIFKKKNEKKE